jgi:transposase-like protein
MQGRQGQGGQAQGRVAEYEQLLADLAAMSWVAVGAKYGVSDNAVRKWLRRYETEREARGDDHSAMAA